MIDEKKIEEVAEDIYEEYFSGNYDYTISEEDHSPLFEGANVIHAVKLGAQWAQKEFVKSLWHDASEKPNQYEMIVAITGGMDSLTNFDAEVYNFPFKMSKGDWVYLVDQDGIVRWCYLSDLLPKEGGKG